MWEEWDTAQHRSQGLLYMNAPTKKTLGTRLHDEVGMQICHASNKMNNQGL